MAKDEKQKVLNVAITQIEKQFGKGSIMRLGDKGAKVDVAVIPTGSIGLDYALGIGGFPRGRVVEIFGPEAGGKTTLALEAIAQAQKMGGTAIFVDVEHAFDPNYAQNLGVNLADLLISQPDTGEQALEITEILTRSGGVDIIVLDSVAALVPKAEIAGEKVIPQHCAGVTTRSRAEQRPQNRAGSPADNDRSACGPHPGRDAQARCGTWPSGPASVQSRPSGRRSRPAQGKSRRIAWARSPAGRPEGCSRYPRRPGWRPGNSAPPRRRVPARR